MKKEKQSLKEQKLAIFVFLSTSMFLLWVLMFHPTTVCAWLRPTESLVLYTQGIGRVLRLHPNKDKAIILDYAGNLQRHGDIDDPIINEALQPTEEKEHDYIIPCLECASCGVVTLNPLSARRCVGIRDGRRCDHYFEWKDCKHCGEKNDKTARACRSCGHELINPNAKLSLKPAVEPRVMFEVRQGKYWVMAHEGGYPSFNAMYETIQGIRIYESFHIKDERMKNIYYGIFVSKQVKNASQYYPVLQSTLHLRKMLDSGDVRTPHQVECKFVNNKYQISRRHFHEDIITL
jgi:DNA repair protein RadD